MHRHASVLILLLATAACTRGFEEAADVLTTGSGSPTPMVAPSTSPGVSGSP
jgi:hypothetical protein